ncbi:hypothetical protein PPERSA_01841 [Pseudocohnilembus persalinus]|uniref:Uncharacterized protein n=1 Tax=Pseudocohnilembus persalinus TaxID=266149 RepID=A0A0V0QKK8_PSEPJ|nr:hypothetical protein PPERSA_01841 [Pseudocohnilembus persalinus]|eukprot:KRX02724.1 hypothetical protein PPERSA_01841 [Pseudocohnilembus persalinus]
MNHNANVVPVDAHLAHSHFYSYIESFHTPEGQKGLEEQGTDIQSQLREQFINDNSWEHKICLRECFKLTSQRYVEYCLDRKCGGVDFFKAANILGYTKQ